MNCIFLLKKILKDKKQTSLHFSLLLSLLRQTKGFFVSHSTRDLKNMPPVKPGIFAYIFSRKQSVKQRKNAAQCISSNLKATSKNSGTFEKQR